MNWIIEKNNYIKYNSCVENSNKFEKKSTSKIISSNLKKSTMHKVV